MLCNITLLQENSLFDRCDFIRNHIELIRKLGGFRLQVLFASLCQRDAGFKPFLLLLAVFLFHLLLEHNYFLLLFPRLHSNLQLCKSLILLSANQLAMSLHNIHHLSIS